MQNKECQFALYTEKYWKCICPTFAFIYLCFLQLQLDMSRCSDAFGVHYGFGFFHLMRKQNHFTKGHRRSDSIADQIPQLASEITTVWEMRILQT